MKKLILLGMALGMPIASSHAATFTYHQLVSCLLKDNVCLSYKPTQGPIVNNGAKPWFYPEQGKDFGTVPVGASRTRSFLVANVGTGPLTVYGFDKGSLADAGMEEALSAVKYNPTPFMLTDSDCPLDGSFVLGVGATCTLKVKFAPSTAGKVGDVLKMLHSSAEVDAVVQDILGEGSAIVKNQNPGSDGVPTTGGTVDSKVPPNTDVTPEMAKTALQFSASSLKFGQAPKDSVVAPLSVVLTNLLDEQLAFSSKRISNGWYKFTDNCGTTLPAKGSCTFQFTMDTSTIIKPSSEDTFKVQFKEGAVGTLKLSGKVLGENVVASPNPAQITGYGLDKETATSLVLSNTGTGPASVSNITVTDTPTGEVVDLGGFAPESLPAPAMENAELVDTLGGFTPSGTGLVRLKSHDCATIAADGSCSIDLTIKSPEEVDTVKYLNYEIGGKTYSVKINAKVAEADLTITPSLVDWGIVPFYSNTEKVLTLTNVGGKTLQGIKLVLPPLFSVVSTTCQAELAADASCTYTLKYSPVETMPANSVREAAVLNKGDIGRIPFAVKGGGEGPVVQASTLDVHFGKVNPQAGYPTTKLSLRNVGTAAATISSIALVGTDFTLVGGTCGTTLAAGSSCDIQVQLNTSVNGEISNKLEITSSSLKNARLSVKVSANVNGALLLATPEKIEFGEVAYGSSQVKSSVVKNQGNMPVKLLNVQANGYRMGVSSTCTTGLVLAPKETCEITFNMPTDAGARDGASASLSIASDSAKSALSVSATGIAKGSYAVVPDSAVAPLTKVGMSSYAVATLSNAAYQPFSISEVLLNADSPNASQWSEATHNCTNIGYNQSCVIRAKFSPTSYGSKPSSISFKSNDARYPTGNIMLQGDGMDGDIAFYVDGTLAKSFDFGRIEFNNAVSKTFTMVNVGVQTTKVNSATSSNGAWGVSGCAGMSLAPGAGCTFTVSSNVPYVSGAEVARTTNFNFTFDKAIATTFAANYRAIGAWPELSNTAVSFDGLTPYNITKTQTITLYNRGNRALTTSNWNVASDSASEVSLNTSACGSLPALTGSCTITITYTSKKDGPLAVLVTAQTNSSSALYSTTKGELKFTVTGTSGAAQPKLSVNMTGTASSKTRTLYLYNAGGSGLTIQSASLNVTQGSGNLPNGYSSCPALAGKSYCAIPIVLQGDTLAGNLTMRITGAAGSDGNGLVVLPLVADSSVYPITDNEAFDFPGAHPTASAWYNNPHFGTTVSDGNYNTFGSGVYKTGDHFTPEMLFNTVYGQSINRVTAYVSNPTAYEVEFGVFDRSDGWSGSISVLLGKTKVPANFSGYIEVNFPKFSALQAAPTAWPWFDKRWSVAAFVVNNPGNLRRLNIHELRVGQTP